MLKWPRHIEERNLTKPKKRSGNRYGMITPLDHLKREGKVISSTFAQLSNLNFSSWVNETLADVLWSVLIASLIERTKALGIFRFLIDNYHEIRDRMGTTMLVHSQLALLSPDAFDDLFGDMVADPEVGDVLSVLLVFDSLPDRHHWRRVLQARDPSDVSANNLASAVATCFDHQSQAATDCRWLRIMTGLAQGKIVITQEMGGIFDEIVGYPDRGDMRAVRPTIRSMEMMTRGPDFNKGAPPPWADEFWDECWKMTSCQVSGEGEHEPKRKYVHIFDQIVDIHKALTLHFLAQTGRQSLTQDTIVASV